MDIKLKSKILRGIVPKKRTGTLFNKIMIEFFVAIRIIIEKIKYPVFEGKLFLHRSIIADKPISDLSRFEATLFSQCGEDGIIDAIFYKVGITNKYFVEFGVQDGVECNTRFLKEKRGWNGLMMDGGDNNSDFIKKEFITVENINYLFKKYDVPREFDLLSIDIDGNDYWVWKAIDQYYSPRVVIIEYNSSIPSTESKTIEYKADFRWDGTDYFGASLLALDKLAKQKGYTLVGCNNIGGNAFYIRDDQLKDNFIIKGMQEFFKPAQYKKSKYGCGHPHSDKPMLEV